MPPIQQRKSTNLTLDSKLLSEARSLEINLSRAAEEGIRTAVRQLRSELWKAENRAALDSSNEFVETRGLPLSDLQQF